MRAVLSLITIISLTFIIGCGFHLRGAITIPENLKTLAITPDNPNEKLQRNIRRVLNKHGVKVVPARTKDVALLEVSEPTFSEQVIALSNNNQPERIKLQISFTYTISDEKGSTIRGPKTINSSKNFTIDPNNILSADSEREVVKRELYQEAVAKLMRQITKAYKKPNSKTNQE